MDKAVKRAKVDEEKEVEISTKVVELEEREHKAVKSQEKG